VFSLQYGKGFFFIFLLANFTSFITHEEIGKFVLFAYANLTSLNGVKCPPFSEKKVVITLFLLDNYFSYEIHCLEPHKIL
jgi:hypothetical protein